MIYLLSSGLAGGLSFARLLLILSLVDEQYSSLYVILHGLMMFSAYSDLGMNQGVLYKAMQSNTDKILIVLNSLAPLLKISILVFPFFVVFVILSVNLQQMTLLSILIASFTYLIANSALNYVQIYFRVLEGFNTLGVINLATAFVTTVITCLIIVFYNGPYTVVWLLLSYPLSVAVVLGAVWLIGKIKVEFRSNEETKLAATRAYIAKGAAVALIGFLLGNVIISDRLIIENADAPWGGSYIFFSVVASLILTFNNYLYHLIFKEFFSHQSKIFGIVMDRSASLNLYLISITIIIFLFFNSARLLIPILADQHAGSIELLSVPIFMVLSFSIIGFVTQFMMAGLPKKTFLTFGCLVLLTYIGLCRGMSQHFEPEEFLIFASVLSALVCFLYVAAFCYFFRTTFSPIATFLASYAMVNYQLAIL